MPDSPVSDSDRRRLRPAGTRDAPPARPPILPTVWRGVRRRCPHCGRGPLFVRWITLHRQCADCGLVYLRNHGDIWFFWIVMDRIPILVGIAAIFFGFRITSWLNGLGFFLAIAGPLIATMPQRQGAAVALSYLSRVYFRDPSDALPEPVDDGRAADRTGTRAAAASSPRRPAKPE
jgi:uncharacterized protein (DUF983 family)